MTGAFAPSFIPNWMQAVLFGIGAIALIVGIFTAALHFVGGWMAENVLWRLRKTPPAGMREPLPVMPPPDWNKAKDDGFDYLVPKALLRVEVPKPRGSISASASGGLGSLGVAISLKTIHKKPMIGCSIVITRFECDGVNLVDSEVVLIGGEEFVDVSPSTGVNFQFIRRNMNDAISPDPFNIKLKSRTLVLDENKQYVGEMELRSRYPAPTVASFQIDTGEGLDVQMTVPNHRVKEVAS